MDKICGCSHGLFINNWRSLQVWKVTPNRKRLKHVEGFAVGSRRRSVSMWIYEKMNSLLVWLITSVNAFLKRGLSLVWGLLQYSMTSSRSWIHLESRLQTQVENGVVALREMLWDDAIERLHMCIFAYTGGKYCNGQTYDSSCRLLPSKSCKIKKSLIHRHRNEMLTFWKADCYGNWCLEAADCETSLGLS